MLQLPLPSSSATANGFDSSTPPSNTLDNNLNTRWSNLGLPSFIQYNLGQSELVCNIDIAWYNGNSRTVTFTISFSNGSTFTNPQTFQSSRTTGLVNYDFPDINAKYVRITVTKNTANNWASINEADIYADQWWWQSFPSTSTSDSGDCNTYFLVKYASPY